MKHELGDNFNSKKGAALYLPDLEVPSVLDIDFAELGGLGIKHVLFDLDLTLRKSKSPTLEASIVEYLHEQHKAKKFESLNLASNSRSDLTPFCQALGAKAYQPFFKHGRLVRKPSRTFFERIIADLKADPREIAMVGDKVRADVGGGNSAGMFTVLVKPLGEDLWHDRLLLVRFREKRLLRSAQNALKIAQKVQK